MKQHTRGSFRLWQESLSSTKEGNVQESSKERVKLLHHAAFPWDELLSDWLLTLLK